MIEHLPTPEILYTYDDLMVLFDGYYNVSWEQIDYAIKELGITKHKQPVEGIKSHNAIHSRDFRKLNQWFHVHQLMTEDETVSIVNKLLNAGVGLNQADIARHLGMSRAIVSLWKSRDRQITRGDYERLQRWYENIVNGK